MGKTIVYIDEGFLAKLSKHFGDGNFLKIDYLKFAKNLCKKENFFCDRIFYYTAPPYQSCRPSQLEKKMKEGHDKFIESFGKNKIVTIREGRVQRLKVNDRFIYKQKGVDTLMTIDLSHIKEDFSYVKTIILISSDTDFVPVIEDLERRGIRVIVYTYFDRIRNSPFSLSNHLLSSCFKCVKLVKKDFLEASK